MTLPASQEEAQRAPAPTAHGRGRDTLSALLMAGMGLLLVMYGVDHYQEEALVAHHERASALRVEGLEASCRASAVGLSGDEVLWQCSGAAREAMREALAASFAAQPAPDWLRGVWLRDGEGTSRCDRALEQCQAYTLPGEEALREARRRRPRAAD